MRYDCAATGYEEVTLEKIKIGLSKSIPTDTVIHQKMRLETFTDMLSNSLLFQLTSYVLAETVVDEVLLCKYPRGFWDYIKIKLRVGSPKYITKKTHIKQYATYPKLKQLWPDTEVIFKTHIDQCETGGGAPPPSRKR